MHGTTNIKFVPVLYGRCNEGNLQLKYINNNVVALKEIRWKGEGQIKSIQEYKPK